MYMYIYYIQRAYLSKLLCSIKYYHASLSIALSCELSQLHTKSIIIPFDVLYSVRGNQPRGIF